MALLEQGTIVALATPVGRGGLAVVRLSGPEAVAIARRLLPPGALADPLRSHQARLATVRWPREFAGNQAGQAPPPGDATPGVGRPTAGSPIDQVLVLPFVAPNSYTGEETVEFHCHGGPLPSRLVIAACRAAGARLATAGEFTRRAFLNGRLSLSQAEAVADLIAAEHAAGARASLAQIRGGLNRQLAAIESPLRDLLARLEGSLEFSEDETVGPAAAEIQAALELARQGIVRLLDLGVAGRRLREGVHVVLVGPPNAGKSSLFNALLDDERALVDQEPGTTRDVVSAGLELDGLLFILHDTAGLREEAGGVEARGIALTRQRRAGADIVLDLLPIEQAGSELDEEIRGGSGTSVLRVWTMADRAPARGAAMEPSSLVTSAVTGLGVEALRRRLLDVALQEGVGEAVDQGVVLNQRHQDRLRACLAVLESLTNEPAVADEVIASLLATALQDLGEVSGRVFTEQLLDDVFGRFCVGK